MPGTGHDGTLLIVAAASLLAAVAAVVLAAVSTSALRRAVSRTAARLRDIGRHPLLGELAADGDPAVAPILEEANRVLVDLRRRLIEAQQRASRLEALVQGPPDLALVATDAEWRVQFFSRGAAALTGWGPVEVLDRHVEVLFAPGAWEGVLPRLARRSLREAGFVETLAWQRRDGTSIPVQLSVGGAEGAEGMVIFAARDAAAQAGAERRLRDSEERHRRVVEGLGDGVLVVQDDRVVYANPALCRLLEVERGAIEGTPFRDLLHAGDLMPVVETLRRAAGRTGASGTLETRLLARGGRPVETRLAWSALEIDGRPGILGTVTDVTAPVHAARALARSEARLRATLDAAGDGIAVLHLGPDGASVGVWNPAFAVLFGLDPRALDGLAADALRSGLEAAAVEAAPIASFMARARAGEEARLEGLELRGERRALVDLLAAPVRSAAGALVGTVLTVRDVTARLEDERALRGNVEALSRAKSELEAANRDLAAARAALAQRNAQLETVNAELKSLDEMKSNLLANVSHELHTPLVSIKGYTEMILKRKLGPLTPEQERGLGVALKNIDRLVEMIDNLLSFSRMEKGETRLTLEDLPFWQLVDEAVELVGERIKKKNITVTTQYETDDLMVRGDRLRLGQVLTNLLTNAVKFNREGGRITLAARRGPQGFLEIDVADTGVGIPPEAQDKIFERFYQADSGPRRRYEGTGIGLSIVRDILRLHGCSIRVSSEADKGSVFTFTLPLSKGGGEPAAARREPRRDRAGS